MPTRSLAELFRIKALWFIFPLMGASYAFPGAARGLWIGPYLADVFATDTATIGQASLLMGLAMVLGALVYGPADRASPSRKWLIAGGTAMTLVAAVTLIALPAASYGLALMPRRLLMILHLHMPTLV